MTARLQVLVVLCTLCFLGINALENAQARTPPMGFNSRYAFNCTGCKCTQFNETTIKSIADIMHSKGLVKLGYNILVLDDCWMNKTRDSEGNIRSDPNRFLDLKKLASYLESKQIKLGLYANPGNFTCEKLPGSGGHEQQDAKRFVNDWGMAYLNYGACNTTEDMRSSAYQTMGSAIKGLARPVIYECGPYMDEPWESLGQTCNLWLASNRIPDDFDAWTAALDKLEEKNVARKAGPGRWNLPDLMQIGNGNQTIEEYRALFSLFSLVASPLFISTDLRNANSEILNILSRQSVIAVNQDSLGIQGRKVKSIITSDIWSKPLANGSFAVALLNRDDIPATISFSWTDLIHEDWQAISTINRSPDGVVIIVDLWSNTSSSSQFNATNLFSFEIASHNVKMLMVTLQPERHADNGLVIGLAFTIPTLAILALVIAGFLFKFYGGFGNSSTDDETEYELVNQQ